jgi:hypothetical protein
MDLLQEIKTLDIEIAEQSSVVRMAGHKYILDGGIRFSSSLLIFIGIFLSVYLMIIGIVLLSLTAFSANKSYRALQAEESALIELQTRRSVLWAEMMSAKE